MCDSLHGAKRLKKINIETCAYVVVMVHSTDESHSSRVNRMR